MAVERRLAAVLASDVVGFSRLMGRDEEGTLTRIKSLFDDVIRPKIAEHRGRLVKTIGDGALAEFASVFNAFRCALDIQEMTARRNEGFAPDAWVTLRIGLNIGDIIFDENDVFGDGVNIAARLERLAKPGGVCVSQRAWEDLRKLPVRFTDLGEQRLRNIAEPVRAFGYMPPEPGAEAGAAGAAGAGPLALARRHWRKCAALGVLALAGGAAVAAGALRAPPAPTPLAAVSAAADRAPCSWLRAQAGGDDPAAVRLSGAALEPADKLSQTLSASARRAGARVDRVEAASVAPLNAAQCAWLAPLKAYRFAGTPRFTVAARPETRGRTRLQLTFDAQALGPQGAVYGIEPSGAVERIVGAAELPGLRAPTVLRGADGAYTLNVDTDHAGWNGLVLMRSDAPVPAGLIEGAGRSPEDRARFDALARAGGWRFDMAWFRAG